MQETRSIKKPILQVGVKFGLYGGVLSIVAFVLFYFIDEQPIPSSKFIDVVIIWLFLFFAIKEFKKYYNNNELTYAQGVSVGIVSFLTTSIVSAMVFYIFLQWIDPAVLDAYTQAQEAVLIENKEQALEKMSEQEYMKKIQSVRDISALGFVAGDFLIKGLVGMFGTILFSALLRKNADPKTK